MVNAQNSAPESPENRELADGAMPEASTDNVDSGQVDNARLIQGVAGAEMSQVSSFADAQNAVAGNTMTPDQNQNELIDELHDVLEEVNQRLANIDTLAGELVQKNLEHRVGDARDIWPIITNIRSHGIASEEGEIVVQLKSEVAALQSLVERYNLELDLSDLVKFSNKIKEPGGATKMIATILPSLRRFHRSMVTPRAEKLKRSASKIRKEIQARTREIGNLVA
jgi:hypothetical protein